MKLGEGRVGRREDPIGFGSQARGTEIGIITEGLERKPKSAKTLIVKVPTAYKSGICLEEALTDKPGGKEDLSNCLTIF